ISELTPAGAGQRLAPAPSRGSPPGRDWPVALATGGCERRPAPTTLGGPPAPVGTAITTGFRTTEGRLSVVSVPTRGNSNVGEHHRRPASGRARRSDPGPHHPSLPGQRPRPGPGRSAPADRCDPLARA